MRTILCVLSCLLFLFCKSQEKERKYAATATAAILSGKVIFQPGLQYSFGKWAIIGEITHLSAKKMNFDKGFWLRGQIELKKFLTEGEIRPYVSFQTAYGRRKFVTKDSGYFYIKNHVDSAAHYTSAVIHSPILSVAPKIGFEMAISKKLSFDWFCGAGVRFIFTKYNAKNVRYLNYYHGSKEWVFTPEESWRLNANLARFHVSTGMRLSFRL